MLFISYFINPSILDNINAIVVGTFPASNVAVAVFNAVTASSISFCVASALSNIACASSIAVLYVAFDPTA
ncbi:hypothetical protein CDPitt_07415 [Clostridioides difficile]|nr:hypothetical protein [Clostridioides difficile]KAK2206895.1 hypothetical protein CDPitt_07415 [Clostridioides difficile]